MHTDLLHLQRYHESGDAGEFQALVQHHAGMVFATARRVTRDSSLAEDVAQETFLELAGKGRSIKESVGAWLHRVAWRRACDMVRAEVTRQRYEAAAVALEHGRECSWEELEPVFDEALSELAPKAREVIVEHYLEGRTQTDIARRLGMSQPSVSRRLDQSMEQLRARLKNKGVFCGVTLGGMMAASSSQSAPASLMASLHKVGLSSIGSGGTAAAPGGGWLGVMTALNIKVIIGGAAALGACALGYDLASEHSRIGQWLVQNDAIRAKPDVSGNHQGPDAAATKARLLMEAQAIWARKPKLSKAEMERLMAIMVLEKDDEKRFTAMHASGLSLSRAEYERIVARHPDIHLFDERKASNARSKLHQDLGASWIMGSPREAVAWLSVRGESPYHWFPAIIAPWVRSHPDEWAAFVEAGPDPLLGEYAKLWMEELADPGSIWAKARQEGIDPVLIEANLSLLIMTEEWRTETLLYLIMRAPDAKVRNEHILGLTSRLTNQQLLRAASSGLFQEAGLVNTLRAMGGYKGTDFKVAGAWVTQASNGGGNEAQLARCMEEAAGRFYAQWIKVDARAALQHAKRSHNEILLEAFMAEGAKSVLVDEALIVESFSSSKNREHSLAAYYLAKAGGDVKTALQSILNSSFVEDEVEGAKQVLTQWANQSAPDAAAWAATLPASEGRDELIAVVASKWAETAPEDAFAFAQKEGVELTHDWAGALAWGLRELPEEHLAAMFATLREDPQYNTLLTRLVSVRYPSHPKEAFALLSKYAAPGWQAPVINDMIEWLEQDDGRAEDYSLLLPTLDLSSVDPQNAAKAAQLLVLRHAHEGKVHAAFDWTLKLPAPIAMQARAEALAGLTSSDAKCSLAAKHWIRTAPIPESERMALLNKASRLKD